MRRVPSVAPLPVPALALAVQDEPLVQTMLTPPVPSTAEAEIVSTLPKASAVVEMVQLAATVALTPRLELCVPATAGLAVTAAATTPSMAADLMRNGLS